MALSRQLSTVTAAKQAENRRENAPKNENTPGRKHSRRDIKTYKPSRPTAHTTILAVRGTNVSNFS